jgi:hypothetical protein
VLPSKPGVLPSDVLASGVPPLGRATQTVSLVSEHSGAAHAALSPRPSHVASAVQVLVHTPQMHWSDPHWSSRSQRSSQCVLLSVPLLSVLPPHDGVTAAPQSAIDAIMVAFR